MEKLLIFPFNGNGLEAVDCIKDQYELLGFIDDDKSKIGQKVCGVNVYGREILNKHPSAKVLAHPGSPQSYLSRSKVINELIENEDRLATVIHPSAKVSTMSKIGKNVLIMAGTVITSNAVVEDHVCLLPNSVIHHDVIIKAYSLIGSNVVIAGNTKIGENVYLGSGSNVINGIEIGDKSLIGLGSNVLKSIPANSIFAGNPAKRLRQ